MKARLWRVQCRVQVLELQRLRISFPPCTTMQPPGLLQILLIQRRLKSVCEALTIRAVVVFDDVQVPCATYNNRYWEGANLLHLSRARPSSRYWLSTRAPRYLYWFLIPTTGKLILAPLSCVEFVTTSASVAL
jgi:hypothetical protein